jgi:hypothetical protein
LIALRTRFQGRDKESWGVLAIAALPLDPARFKASFASPGFDSFTRWTLGLSKTKAFLH